MRMLPVGAALCAALLATAACDTSSNASPNPSPDPKPAAALRMVTNHGHRLAFHLIPGKLPAVVLDAGGGEDSSYWKTVAPALAAATGSEVITYDRAGMGASDEVPGPWRVTDAVSDLRAGLTALGATRDVILVAHSEAGEIATYFTRANPTWVAGAVLIDASLPDFYTDDETARIVAANQPGITALAKQPSTRQTRQLLAVAQDYAPMHRAYHLIGWPASVPVTVVASTATPFPTSLTDAQRWRAAQATFAQGAPNRDYIVAAHTSHDVPLDRPDIVTAAVTDLIHRVS